jgi:hypothetical protein
VGQAALTNSAVRIRDSRKSTPPAPHRRLFAHPHDANLNPFLLKIFDLFTKLSQLSVNIFTK